MVSRSVTLLSSAKTAEAIKMPFALRTRLGQRNHVLDIAERFKPNTLLWTFHTIQPSSLTCLLCTVIPVSVGCNYTVLISKHDGHCRALSVDDFRGISIRPVISKLFEMAILDRFSVFFTTSDHQFEFKKNLSCRHAVYCVRNVVESYVNNGSTVSMCALDLTKDHHALFVKLIKRKFPSELLSILETWFRLTVSCVRWGTSFSIFSHHQLEFAREEFCHSIYLPYLWMIFLTKYKCQTLDVTSHRYVLVFICMLTMCYYWPQLSPGYSIY